MNKRKLENLGLKIIAGIGIALAIVTIIALDVGFKTLILHQPAKCAFVKCVVIIKP